MAHVPGFASLPVGITSMIRALLREVISDYGLQLLLIFATSAVVSVTTMLVILRAFHVYCL